MMTRRDILALAAAAPVLASTPASPLAIPIHRITDAHARIPPDKLRRFWSNLWPEAVRDFARGGMALHTTDGPGEIRRTAADKPIFIGLQRGVINLVLTSALPLYWDEGRARAGVTTIVDGCHVCTLALAFAHGDQVPFFSLNTCVHELLHALMQDIYITHPKWYQSGSRELGVDYHATLLWLFHDGTAVRRSADAYLRRLRSQHA